MTHKLPVTNDLSSMQTTLKGNKSQQQKPKEEEKGKGVFGFIKKIFGKE